MLSTQILLCQILPISNKFEKSIKEFENINFSFRDVSIGNWDLVAGKHYTISGWKKIHMSYLLGIRDTHCHAAQQLPKTNWELAKWIENIWVIELWMQDSLLGDG